MSDQPQVVKRGRRAVLSEEGRKANRLESKKRYREKNKEMVALRKQEWKDQNREHVRKYGREYYYKKSIDDTIQRLETKLSELAKLKCADN